MKLPIIGMPMIGLLAETELSDNTVLCSSLQNDRADESWDQANLQNCLLQQLIIPGGWY